MPNIFMRYPGGRDRALTLSYDDGVHSDIRLIDIMRQHGLKGTFNINSDLFAPEDKVWPEGTLHRRMKKSEAFAAYRDSGMEVAVHGAEHPYWNLQPDAVATLDIIRDREQLEDMFGTIIRGAAYPYGASSDAVVDILSRCGILYCRTTNSTGSFGFPTNWLRLAPTCHHNDPRLMELAHAFVDNTKGRAPLLFYVWGHSYEFDDRQNWNVIEEFAEFIGNRENVWYATNIEIFDYATAYSRLQCSADLKRVYNPSFTELWFVRGNKTYSVKPGELLTLA